MLRCLLGLGSSAMGTTHAGPRYRPKPQPAAPGATAFEPVPAMEPALKAGRRAKAAMKAAGYDDSVPRCETCTSYGRRQIRLFNSLPVFFPTRCLHHLVRVSPMGCCDSWQGKDGDVLEP
jgi:hypothetical protein